MGACTSAKKRQHEFKGDQEPPDTEDWNLPNLPSMETEIRISNFKIKNSPYGEASAVISIANIIEVKLERKKNPKNIKWTFEQFKRARLTEYELRRKFLFVSVYHSEVKVAEVKLNLFLIATGPFHLDFPLKYTNKAEGRFSLDVRISQVVPVIIESKMAAIQLLVDRPGESFNYSFRSIVNAFKDSQSLASSIKKLSVNFAQVEQRQKNRASSSSARQSGVQEASQLVWDEQSSKLPFVKSIILGSKVPNACLQFLLWTIEMPGSDVNLAHLVGQCYISYSKLLKKEYVIEERQGRRFQIYQVQVKEKLWYHGKHTANATIYLKLTVPKFYKQLAVYVRTQEGIVKSSPVIVLDAKAPECPQLGELVKSKDNVEEWLRQLDECAGETKPGTAFKITDLRGKVQKDLAKQLLRLKTSEKQSTIMYNYRSQEQLIKAQTIFLDIGFKLLVMVEDDNSSFRESAFSCLVALMKRGQLSLLFMGFLQEQKEQIQNHKMSKIVHDKYENAIKMQQFLYHVLQKVLVFLNEKTLQENERVFVELFSAYSYFRVPQFRERLLSTLNKPDDPQVVEWRGTQYSLEKDETPTLVSTRETLNNTNTFSLLFDWQNNFYDAISSDQRYTVNQAQLFEYLDHQPWRQRMAKRGIGFFFFLIYWVRYVETIAVISENIKWQNIPGYTNLLKALLCEMKKRPVIDYPDSLLDASLKMLTNEKLLNPYITIILNKTNMFDSAAVLKAIDIINSYFQELAKAHKNIHTSFNYSVLLAGMKTIILSDHSYAIGKCLLLYYNHYNMLNFNIRKDLNMFLLGRVFFKLFLNWSINVRVVFHHLLIFRILLQSGIVRKDKAEIVQMEYAVNQDMKRRYAVLIGMLETAKEKRDQDDCKKFAYGYEKEYYKKMRKKLQQHKRAGFKNPHIMRKLTNPLHRKFTVEQLIKGPHLRMKSQAMGVKVSYDKPLVSQANLYHQIDSEDPQDQLSLNSRSSNKILLKRQTSHEKDFEIKQIEERQLEYLSKSLGQFKQIEEKFEKFFTKHTEKDPVPSVIVRVPIDEVDLRPFHIDQW